MEYELGIRLEAILQQQQEINQKIDWLISKFADEGAREQEPEKSQEPQEEKRKIVSPEPQKKKFWQKP